MKRLVLASLPMVVAASLCTAQAPAAALKGKARALRILGQAEHRHIVGGFPAAAGTYPMMAFVVYEDPSTQDISLCSGTVVSPELLLTAGHCAEDSDTGIAHVPAGYAVVTGSLDWTGATRQVSAVSRVIVNPAYSSGTGDDDSALLELSTPTTAPAVTLASEPRDSALMQPGQLAQIAGWGLTSADSIPDQLQWGVTVVQSAGYCATEAAYGQSTFDAGGQMCAIDAPSFADGTCNGDSGGPLLATRADGTLVEIGMTHSGAADCNPAVPNFFTRVDAISSWVAGWAQALAAPAAPSAPVATPPAASPAPAPTVSAKPIAGPYRGSTSQRWPITLRVSASRTALSSLSFSFSLSCARHGRVSYSMTPGRGHISWQLNQNRDLGFDRAFSDTTGEHYDLWGNFDSSGSAAGFLTTTWHSRRFGMCRSGLVRWWGHLARKV